MKILVVGPGGREHAIAKALSRELGSARCYFSPGHLLCGATAPAVGQDSTWEDIKEGSGMQSFKDNTVAWLPIIETVSS